MARATTRISRTPAPVRKRAGSTASVASDGGTASDSSGSKSRRKHSSSNTSKQTHVEYEFGGPWGALGVVVGLPLVIYLLFFLCNGQVCVGNPFSFAWGTWYRKHLPRLGDLVSTEAWVMYLGWMAFHVLLERVLPGEIAEGVELPDKVPMLSRCCLEIPRRLFTLTVPRPDAPAIHDERALAVLGHAYRHGPRRPVHR